VITEPQGSHILANRGNNSGSFLAIDKRQWRGITALAKINVDKVNASCVDLDQRFIWFGIGYGQVYERKHFWSANPGNLNGFHEGRIQH
jgi:hypothetical protein